MFPSLWKLLLKKEKVSWEPLSYPQIIPASRNSYAMYNLLPWLQIWPRDFFIVAKIQQKWWDVTSEIRVPVNCDSERSSLAGFVLLLGEAQVVRSLGRPLANSQLGAEALCQPTGKWTLPVTMWMNLEADPLPVGPWDEKADPANAVTAAFWKIWGRGTQIMCAWMPDSRKLGANKCLLF